MKAVSKLQETEFRGVELDQEQLELLGSRKAGSALAKETTQAPRSSVMPVIDMNSLKRMDTLVEAKEIILAPLSNLKLAQKDQIDKVKVVNMRALVDEGKREINNRTIVPMDSEPMHLL